MYTHTHPHTHMHLDLKSPVLSGHSQGWAGTTLKDTGGASFLPRGFLCTHTQPTLRPALDSGEASLSPSQIPVAFCQQLLPHFLYFLNYFIEAFFFFFKHLATQEAAL